MSSDHTDSKIRKAIADNVRAEVARAGRDLGDLAAEIFRGSRMTAWRRTTAAVAFSGAELVRIAAWLEIPITTLIAPEVMDLAAHDETRAVAA